MKGLKFILTGIFFGIVMAKSEAISWYRIQEMFRFQSFHMYGIIGIAVFFGLIAVYLIKKNNINDVEGQQIRFQDKKKGWPRYLIGGTVFGLGWALTGACPGPMFVNIGYGYISMGLVVLGALAGTFLYGIIKDHLPH
ncbi:YeeE/YedE family protein [Pedobacter sp. GR22-6]|uniref:YeeE/YedE family protein n=1 Tax=Pedobacter sp. GR22-6 TaxID=3127957 RepID=UPI00307EC27E